MWRVTVVRPGRGGRVDQADRHGPALPSDRSAPRAQGPRPHPGLPEPRGGREDPPGPGARWSPVARRVPRAPGVRGVLLVQGSASGWRPWHRVGVGTRCSRRKRGRRRFGPANPAQGGRRDQADHGPSYQADPADKGTRETSYTIVRKD